MAVLTELSSSKAQCISETALKALETLAAANDDDALQTLVSLALSAEGPRSEKLERVVWAAVFRRPLSDRERAKTYLSLGIHSLTVLGAQQLVEQGDLSALGVLKTEAAKGDISVQYTIAKTVTPATRSEAQQFLFWLFKTTRSQLVRKTILWTLRPHAAVPAVASFLREVIQEHPDLARHETQGPTSVLARDPSEPYRRAESPFSRSDCYLPVWNTSSRFLVGMLKSYGTREQWHKSLRASLETGERRDRLLDALHKMTQFDDTTVSTMAKDALAYIDSLNQEKSLEPKAATVEPTESGSALTLPLAIGGAVVAVAIAALLLRRRPRRKS